MIGLKANLEVTFDAEQLSDIKRKVLYGFNSYSTFAYLDNNNYQHAPNRYELLVAVGVHQWVACNALDAHKGQWIFGHLAYDYKNELFPALVSQHQALDAFEHQQFFIPQIVIAIPHASSVLQIFIQDDALQTQTIWQQIEQTEVNHNLVPLQFDATKWTPVMDVNTYMARVAEVRQHILEGDGYELNLCAAYYRQVKNIAPHIVFDCLNQENPAPFACFYRQDDQYLLSTSPERYVYRHNEHIISQPIKGTIKKSLDASIDDAHKQQLQADIKERAENIMITDLVRNDIAQLCHVGSVQVPELCGLYSFASLHHLISTIQGELKSNLPLNEMLEVPFPMGSMTGAPKYIVMQIIEQLELFKRGIYAGSVGYIQPNQDFDFNVVIRSAVYNASNKQLAFHTGSAITIDSTPEQEWAELQLKAQRIMHTLNVLSEA